MTRPDTLESKTHKKKTGCGSLYVIVGTDNGKIMEVICRMGKGGGCAASQCEALGRLVSCAVQAGTPLSILIKALKGIICHMKVEESMSCADGLGKVLAKYEEETIAKGTTEKTALCA